ncbi:ESAT-6-like protein EsxB [Corynebacterium glaucum]|uniref:ESAT-6-like protein n=1 Tax=Corynebacterium glaucum TaxID=187491 RepID=A0A1Q2HUB8_9CORY|nr:WXG100 family type VII secretion target [Corynebacterium glaucum]AQQ14421.1 ESAT-6-like protein EsxB [Corynebacterium glaucum]WJZ06948.1 ESAT-6-like protein EsxB [Corynebacterium glaucum]
MSQFATEAEVMRATAGHVDAVNAEVNQEIDRIQDVAQSVRGSWEGRAQRSFDELMVRYDDAQRRLTEALTSIAVNIRDNAKHYEHTDVTTTEGLDRISAGSGLAL